MLCTIKPQVLTVIPVELPQGNQQAQPSYYPPQNEYHHQQAAAPIILLRNPTNSLQERAFNQDPVVVRIISFLNIISLTKFAVVCKKGRKLVAKHPIFHSILNNNPAIPIEERYGKVLKLAQLNKKDGVMDLSKFFSSIVVLNLVETLLDQGYIYKFDFDYIHIIDFYNDFNYVDFSKINKIYQMTMNAFNNPQSTLLSRVRALTILIKLSLYAKSIFKIEDLFPSIRKISDLHNRNNSPKSHIRLLNCLDLLGITRDNDFYKNIARNINHELSVREHAELYSLKHKFYYSRHFNTSKYWRFRGLHEVSTDRSIKDEALFYSCEVQYLFSYNDIINGNSYSTDKVCDAKVFDKLLKEYDYIAKSPAINPELRLLAMQRRVDIHFVANIVVHPRCQRTRDKIMVTGFKNMKSFEDNNNYYQKERDFITRQGQQALDYVEKWYEFKVSLRHTRCILYKSGHWTQDDLKKRTDDILRIIQKLGSKLGSGLTF